MNKSDLISAVAEQTGRAKVDAELFLNATLDVIQKSLEKGETIPLIGFGTFSISKRAARPGRNPRTGESIKIAASQTVKFSAGSKLKAAVKSK